MFKLQPIIVFCKMAPTYRRLGHFCKSGDHKNCWIPTTFNFILLFLHLKNQPNLSGVLSSPTCSCKHSVWTLGDFNIIWYMSQVSFFRFLNVQLSCTKIFVQESLLLRTTFFSVQCWVYSLYVLEMQDIGPLGIIKCGLISCTWIP